MKNLLSKRLTLTALAIAITLTVFGCDTDTQQVSDLDPPATQQTQANKDSGSTDDPSSDSQTGSQDKLSATKKMATEPSGEPADSAPNSENSADEQTQHDKPQTSEEEGFFDENWKPKERIEKEIQTIDLPKTWKRFGKKGVDEVWVDQTNKECIVAGYICRDEHALEMFACPRGTKEHESVIAVNSSSQIVHAGLLLTGVEEGKPVQWAPDYIPASGPVIEITVMWKDKKSGKVMRRNAKEMVINAETKKEMQHDWVFGGSQIVEHGGEPVYYANAGELVCLSNFSTATLDVPIQSTDAASGLLFGANKEKIPELGTKVYMILKPTGEVIKPVAPAKPKGEVEELKDKVMDQVDKVKESDAEAKTEAADDKADSKLKAPANDDKQDQ